MLEAVHDAIAELYPDKPSIPFLNDRFGHEAVLAVFDRALENCPP